MTRSPRNTGPIDLRQNPLILASGSPRRIQLLSEMGVPFETQPSGVEEPALEGRRPEELAIEAARLKAGAIAAFHPQSLVLGADTIVCLEERILGKPQDEAEARSMLLALRGRWHEVITGLCLIAPESNAWTAFERTRVRMETFMVAELEDYLASGEPYDKAGGYAIQGNAARFVAEIEGDYFNVVGLPLNLMMRGMREFALLDSFQMPSPPSRFR